MPKQFYRSSFFHFLEQDSYQYLKDGILVVQDGIVLELGEAHDILERYQPEINSFGLVNYPGRLIMPGMIDMHTHYPQMEMIASHGEELLDWLNRYTFPTELQYKNKEYAKKVSKRFLKELLKNGTTTALIFPTVHQESVEAIFEEAQILNMRIISGKVLMDRHAPDGLLDSAEKGFLESKELIRKWHNNGRIQYAITPRFAPTSSFQQLALAGELRRQYPDVFVQTHLSENQKEVEWVRSLFPNNPNYLDVYARNNLIGRRTVFAHGIYLDEPNFKLLHETGSAISFCPSSNLFLGSGLFKLAEAEHHRVHVGLGTDVGAGTSLSMLQTMGDAYKVIQMHRAYPSEGIEQKALSSLQSFYLATLGAACALDLNDKLGNFLPGKEADFVVLNPKQGSSQLQWRMEKAKTLEEQLFVYQILGDDRVFEQTYLMGGTVTTLTG